MRVPVASSCRQINRSLAGFAGGAVVEGEETFAAPSATVASITITTTRSPRPAPGSSWISKRCSSAPVTHRADQCADDTAHCLDFPRRPFGLGEDCAQRILSRLSARWRMEISLELKFSFQLA